uniref:Cytochrome P450 family 19 subfamily A member 1 n=1 Tax=Saimiri boliviensis boliviensis TaxID=39432 RepID=A0A2K6UK06_SAIBB
KSVVIQLWKIYEYNWIGFLPLSLRCFSWRHCKDLKDAIEVL